VAAAAAAGRVSGIFVDKTIALAAKGEAGRVKWSLQGSGAVRAEVNRAGRLGATDVVSDLGREIVAIDERDIIVIPVPALSSAQGPFGEGSRRNTSAGAGITEESTVASTISARVGTRVRREVAVAASPDTTSFPVIRNVE